MISEGRKNSNQLARQLLPWVLLASLIPLMLNILGYDFGSSASSSTLSISFGQRDLNSLFHTILEWTAVAIALFTVILALIQYKLSREVATLIIATALFFAGVMDAFHILAANGLFPVAISQPDRLIPFTWVMGRILNALIVIAGASFLLFRFQGDADVDQTKATGLGKLMTIFFMIVTYAVIEVCLTTTYLPHFVGTSGFVTRPLDLIPLGLFLVAGLVVYPRFYKRFPSLFSLALILSVIPLIMASGYMAFGSKEFFDNGFYAAHFLKIVAYAIPFGGLVLDYVRTYRERERGQIELQDLNQTLEMRVEERTRELQDQINIRKKAEYELASEKENLAVTLRSIQEGVITTEERGRIIFINEAAEKILGIKLADVIGKECNSIYNVMGETSRQPVGNILEKSLKIGENAYSQEPLILVTNSGAEKFVAQSCAVIQEASGQVTGAVLVFRDITESKRLEEEFRQAQKMEAIGRLAGGIAHEFNNLLAVIKGFVQLRERALPLDETGTHHFQQINKATKRAAELTSQLLTFSRRQVFEPKVLNLNQLILDFDPMIRRLIGADVELVVLPSSKKGVVKVDGSQIEHVLINLVVNARDAMPEGGKLIIETQDVTMSAKYAKAHNVKAGEYVMLAVSDTGTGMTREVQDKIFEPFFTTKGKEEGTGLGLATSHSFVEQSGGFIWVYSEPGNGSTFEICFPLSQGKPKTEKIGETPMGMPRGTEMILVAEDEGSLRGLACDILKEAGYSVLEASNGEEALNLVKRNPDQKIDLLLTDVVMPQMGGKELGDKFKIERPDAKVIYMSGFTDGAIGYHGFQEQDFAFLQKPFMLEALVTKVREVLDENAQQLSPADK